MYGKANKILVVEIMFHIISDAWS